MASVEAAERMVFVPRYRVIMEAEIEAVDEEDARCCARDDPHFVVEHGTVDIQEIRRPTRGLAQVDGW